MLRATRHPWIFVSMDKLDAKILDLLQQNAELTAAEIAARQTGRSSVLRSVRRRE